MELDLVLLPRLCSGGTPSRSAHTHTHTFFDDVGHKWGYTTAGRWLEHKAGIILNVKKKPDALVQYLFLSGQ